MGCQKGVAAQKTVDDLFPIENLLIDMPLVVLREVFGFPSLL